MQKKTEGLVERAVNNFYEQKRAFLKVLFSKNLPKCPV